MLSVLFKYVIENVVAYIVDIDGLLYAPVLDLRELFIRCLVNFALAAVVAALLAFGGSWAWYKFRNHPPRG